MCLWCVGGGGGWGRVKSLTSSCAHLARFRTSVQALGCTHPVSVSATPTIILKASKVMVFGRAELFMFSYIVCAVVPRSPVDPAVLGPPGKPEASPYITRFLFIRLTASMLPHIRATRDIGGHLVPGLIGELSLGPSVVPLHSFPHSLPSGGLPSPIYRSVVLHPSEASPHLNEI